MSNSRRLVFCHVSSRVNRLNTLKLALELANEDVDTFRCPSTSTKYNDEKGQTVAHPKYAHETDCQKFYVCLNGIDKRPLGCPAGQVYNDQTEMCDAPENVPGW